MGVVLHHQFPWMDCKHNLSFTFNTERRVLFSCEQRGENPLPHHSSQQERKGYPHPQKEDYLCLLSLSLSSPLSLSFLPPSPVCHSLQRLGGGFILVVSPRIAPPAQTRVVIRVINGVFLVHLHQVLPGLPGPSPSGPLLLRPLTCSQTQHTHNTQK